MDPTFDSPFYRVTAKALIFNDAGQLLVLKNADNNWELPGGGWEHDEPFEDCLRRELQEELGAELASVSRPLFMYRRCNDRRGFMVLRIVVRAQVKECVFTLGEDMQDYGFVDREAFVQLDWQAAEGDVMEYVDQIWPES